MNRLFECPREMHFLCQNTCSTSPSDHSLPGVFHHLMHSVGPPKGGIDTVVLSDPTHANRCALPILPSHVLIGHDSPGGLCLRNLAASSLDMLPRATINCVTHLLASPLVSILRGHFLAPPAQSRPHFLHPPGLPPES
jgi:hypothetical protein